MSDFVRLLLVEVLGVVEGDAELTRRINSLCNGGVPAAVVTRRTCATLGLTPKAFDAHAGVSFPAYKAGRTVVARREDVVAWILSRPVRPPGQPTTDPKHEARAAVDMAAARLTRRRA